MSGSTTNPYLVPSFGSYGKTLNSSQPTVTYIPFTPSPTQPFQTLIVLDGANYNLAVRWNVYRGGSIGVNAGWYVQIDDQNGNNVYYGAMVGSPPNFNITLAPGFTSTLVFRVSTQQFEVSP